MTILNAHAMRSPPPIDTADNEIENSATNCVEELLLLVCLAIVIHPGHLQPYVRFHLPLEVATWNCFYAFMARFTLEGSKTALGLGSRGT